MNKQDYDFAISKVRADSPIEYGKKLKPIQFLRYNYLKGLYIDIAAFRKAYKNGLIGRYELPAGNLHKELLAKARI